MTDYVVIAVIAVITVIAVIVVIAIKEIADCSGGHDIRVWHNELSKKKL